MNLERLEKLIGLNNVVKVKNLNVLIVGVGGVGGYTLESLVRSGVNNISIIDGDVVDETNLNRQIISTLDNIGKLKVIAARQRAVSINSDIKLLGYEVFLNEETIKKFDISSFDYVVDACDDIDAKVLLINECLKNNVKIISSMGTANQMNASKLELTKLYKTKYDPLAKKLRKLIDKDKQKNVIVVSSAEEIRETEGLGSNSFVPAVAGLLITDYIINDTIEKVD